MTNPLLLGCSIDYSDHGLRLFVILKIGALREFLPYLSDLFWRLYLRL